MKKPSTLLLIVFLLNVVNPLKAQDFSMGISTGISSYFGDLMYNNSLFNQSSPAFSVSGSYDFTDRFRTRLNLSFLTVKGDDAKSPDKGTHDRNLNFVSNVIEASLLAEIDIVDGTKNANAIYLFTGPGVFYYDPTTLDRSGKKVHLHDWGTEGQTNTKYNNLQQIAKKIAEKSQYHKTALSYTAGVGMRHDITPFMSVGVEFGYRFTNTDYLDDVSNATYVDPTLVTPYVWQLAYRGDEINAKATSPGWQPRGNPNKMDAYYTMQVRVAFKLGRDNNGMRRLTNYGY